ncbi:glycoside hydrolase family 2 protein [Marinilabiliaceae bacterium JC017]|nr:glycoside hydrolase family 2 protein [Marinilabiliaceae bacterium JC017]
MRRLDFLILAFISLVGFGCQPGSEAPLVTQRFLHQNWQFSQADKTEWLPATVPGVVHLDLFDNKVIDDPFYRSNEDSLKWIGEKDWIYKTSFSIDKELSADKVDLVFEGLDTHATVELNGQEIIAASNMFRSYRSNIKKLLQKGTNELIIRFQSPLKYNKQQAGKLAYSLPEDERVHSRKAPYQFGWDWGPVFITAGIWRPVYIETYNSARISDVQLIQKELSDDNASLTAAVTVEASKKGKAKLTISSPDNKFESITQTVVLDKGTNKTNLNFVINKPQRWWCNGMGKATLYKVETKITTDAGIQKTIDKIGLRTIELVQEKDKTGKSFYFKLNGIPVFAKGANYIPQESFLPRLTKAQYEARIDDAVKANYNMLRVWGGGIYEDDLFYELCDEKGIMVWQDFMFACAMYPGDDTFMENVRVEVEQNVRRLRNHASLVLWCGNNEIANGWHDWGWQKSRGYSAADSLTVWTHYQNLFHQLIPEILEEEDPGKAYWSSSPSFGWGHEEALTEGDNHYWGVWWGKEPFDMYKQKVSRFMSEFGFQAFPDINTIKSFTKPKDRDIWSKVMRTHQKHPIGNETIMEYLKRDYKTPKDFESFVYLSQVLQAEGMMTGIAAHRRNMPVSMGTLYWQFNDCWPVVSWSSVDYYGHWKALHYYARKAFANIFVSPDIEGDQLKVFIVSDNLEPTSGELEMTLMDFGGKVKWSKSMAIDAKPINSTLAFEQNVTSFLQNLDKRKAVLKTVFKKDGKEIAENFQFFVSPKKMLLQKPDIKLTTKRLDNSIEVILSSKTLCKNVFLSLGTVKGWWSNNYFDLLPGEEKRVVFYGDDLPNNITDLLTVFSLYNSFK